MLLRRSSPSGVLMTTNCEGWKESLKLRRFASAPRSRSSLLHSRTCPWNCGMSGWVQKRRNLGSLIFVDLRDRSGIMQILFDENIIGAEGFAKAGTVRSEYVLAVTGKMQRRSA